MTYCCCSNTATVSSSSLLLARASAIRHQPRLLKIFGRWKGVGGGAPSWFSFTPCTATPRVIVRVLTEETQFQQDTNGGGYNNNGNEGGGGGGGGGNGDNDKKEGKGGDSNDKEFKMSMSQKLTLAYAFLVGVGGVMGYVKGGSQKSLAAGSSSALLLYYVYTQLPVRPTFASSIGFGLSAALLGVMGSRFKKSRKIFPAGVVSFVSLVMTGGYLHGIMRGMH